MVKKSSANQKGKALHTGLFVLFSTAVAVIVLLLVHINTLSFRIVSLENRANQTAEEIASYQRAYCTSQKGSVKSSKTTKHITTSAGYERSYRVHTPKNYDPSVRYPVIVNFDGIDGSGAKMQAYSGVDALPVIAVYPDSLLGTQGFTAWQGAPYSVQGDRDVRFVETILEELPGKYCVDSTKVFAVGMSNGGGFATIVSCQFADKFRAVVTVSGAYYRTECASKVPQPSIMAIHSTADKQVPYMGSQKKRIPEVAKWAKAQAEARQCKEALRTKEIGTVKRVDWFNCKNDAIVRLVVLKNQNHGWLTLPQELKKEAPNISKYIWDFFQEATYRG